MEAFRAPGTAQAEYCSRCIQYVSQVTGKSGSRSTYTVTTSSRLIRCGTVHTCAQPMHVGETQGRSSSL